MKLFILMKSQAKPIIRKNVINSYTKEGVFCIYMEGGIVKKYPLVNITSILEKGACKKAKASQTVKIHLLSDNKPTILTKAVKNFTKDELFCVQSKNGDVLKTPLVNIFEIEEAYN